MQEQKTEEVPKPEPVKEEPLQEQKPEDDLKPNQELEPEQETKEPIAEPIIGELELVNHQDQLKENLEPEPEPEPVNHQDQLKENSKIEPEPETESVNHQNQLKEDPKIEPKSEPEPEPVYEAPPEPEPTKKDITPVSASPEPEIQIPRAPPVQSAEKLVSWFEKTQKQLSQTVSNQQLDLDRLENRIRRVRNGMESWSRAVALEKAIGKAGNILNAQKDTPSSPLERLEISRSITDMLSMQIDPNVVEGLEKLLVWLGVTTGDHDLINIEGSPTWRIDRLAKNIDDCCNVFHGHDVSLKLEKARDDFFYVLAELRLIQTNIRRLKSGAKYVAERCLSTMARINLVLPQSMREPIYNEWKPSVINACQYWPRSKLCKTKFVQAITKT